ncbi:hypothetical protein FTO74_04915 [Granulicella sp. WH15]|uniref:hypothetical protein n=1 Tax=Granulicella sp. WH15 TaxID=2602070 RepID=UPI0013676264|nr:hypothetical protein [Granulicella sp. WH15]QHN02784.1 hypothetical protein FTO74_04915 [Granulicella sp. WH15]
MVMLSLFRLNNTDGTRKMNFGLSPHGPAHAPLGEKFVAFLSQRAPTDAVFAIFPIYNAFAVYTLASERFHGMEEVIGSIPIRSTNKSNDLAEIVKSARYAFDTSVLMLHFPQHFPPS